MHRALTFVFVVALFSGCLQQEPPVAPAIDEPEQSMPAPRDNVTIEASGNQSGWIQVYLPRAHLTDRLGFLTNISWTVAGDGHSLVMRGEGIGAGERPVLFPDTTITKNGAGFHEPFAGRTYNAGASVDGVYWMFASTTAWRLQMSVSHVEDERGQDLYLDPIIATGNGTDIRIEPIDSDDATFKLREFSSTYEAVVDGWIHGQLFYEEAYPLAIQDASLVFADGTYQSGNGTRYGHPFVVTTNGKYDLYGHGDGFAGTNTFRLSWQNTASTAEFAWAHMPGASLLDVLPLTEEPVYFGWNRSWHERHSS